MKPLGCAPYPQTRRHPRTAGGADAPHLCTSKRYDPKADELLLGTDAVDVVVKATVARAGQIAAATENSIAEPAPSTAETSAGSSLFRCSEEPQHNVKGLLTGRSRRINHSTRALETRRSKTLLFDHLVGAGEQRRRHFERQRPGSAEINHQLELRRLHDREVCRLGTLEDATGIDPDLTIRVRDVRAVAHQPADFDILTRSI